MAMPKESGSGRPNRAPARNPAVAGKFYPAGASECRALAQGYVDAGANKFGATCTNATNGTKRISGTPSGVLRGGIVPHAGWICSGAIAGETIGALKITLPDADLIVVFGAIHTPIPIDRAALDSYSAWIEPSGESLVTEAVRNGLAEKSDSFVVDDRFHRHEHAVEVELPLIEIAWPGAVILPVEVPLASVAIQIGQETARRAMALNCRPIFLASSDLTHYGPAYGFAPAGIGTHGLDWARQNDRLLLERVGKFDVNAIVPEVATRANACGGGAIAAMLAACREYGASSSIVLTHASSFETLRNVAPQRPDNAVGYAAVIVG
jgi:MEMO1 family protein